MPKYETLDYENWNEIRSISHQMIDDAIDYLKDIRERPVWRPMTDDDHQPFNSSAPEGQKSPSEVYRLYREQIQPFVMGNPHPRFWAWYMGSSTFMGAMADFLTSLTNSNAGAGNHVGQFLEDQVMSWMSRIIGYSDKASGIIVSGGSMANFVGLAVARHVKAGYDIRREGILAGGKQMTIYASSEVHSCNQKAIELLGIGNAHFRRIAVHENYQIDHEELRQQIKFDREKGLHPICVIGSAGTVNTGAIDDLEALADICQEEDLWYHVDGAIGGIAMISETVKPLLKGIERSDSIAMDLHKWLHIPFEAGCVLVRNREEHRDTFHISPEYLAQNARGLASGFNWYSEYGLQLSRRLRALKIWMTIEEHGISKLGRMISRNVDQALYLGKQIEANENLELMAPIGLDIVCFRYNPGVPKLDLNAINKEILILLHERGLAIPSYTTLKGCYCIRVAIANHRSRYEDFDFLIEKSTQLGSEITNPTL